jgi:hypothetical protein
MKIPENYIKIFPEYEDVFYDDLENHKKYFLPLCSINLKFFLPEKDQWLHFVSVKEIYDGRVGENAVPFHTTFTKCDMFGFDVIDGKYKFDADWNYFSVATEILPGNYHSEYSSEEIEYNFNDSMYQLKKAYFKKYGSLYAGDFNRPGLGVFDIRKLERLRQLTPEDLHNDTLSDYLLDKINGKINGVLDEININNAPLEDGEFGGENLMEKPFNSNKQLFNYIGCMEGYNFQEYAADQLYLFHDSELNKAVICLEYT